jgi:hypothetical protein
VVSDFCYTRGIGLAASPEVSPSSSPGHRLFAPGAVRVCNLRWFYSSLSFPAPVLGRAYSPKVSVDVLSGRSQRRGAGSSDVHPATGENPRALGTANRLGIG